MINDIFVASVYTAYRDVRYVSDFLQSIDYVMVT